MRLSPNWAGHRIWSPFKALLSHAPLGPRHESMQMELLRPKKEDATTWIAKLPLFSVTVAGSWAKVHGKEKEIAAGDPRRQHFLLRA